MELRCMRKAQVANTTFSRPYQCAHAHAHAHTRQAQGVNTLTRPTDGIDYTLETAFYSRSLPLWT